KSRTFSRPWPIPSTSSPSPSTGTSIIFRRRSARASNWTSTERSGLEPEGAILLPEHRQVGDEEFIQRAGAIAEPAAVAIASQRVPAMLFEKQFLESQKTDRQIDQRMRQCGLRNRSDVREHGQPLPLAVLIGWMRRHDVNRIV